MFWATNIGGKRLSFTICSPCPSILGDLVGGTIQPPVKILLTINGIIFYSIFYFKLRNTFSLSEILNLNYKCFSSFFNPALGIISMIRMSALSVCQKL